MVATADRRVRKLSHTGDRPEIPSYQSRISYLAQQTQAAALPWPIAIDNDYRIWSAYGVSAWPTQLVFDKNGRRLRNAIVGDSQDDAIDSTIRKLVALR